MVRHGVSLRDRLGCGELWEFLPWALDVGRENDIFFQIPSSTVDWRTTTWWRTRGAKGTHEDPANVLKWEHRWGQHNRGVVWDTPFARWAGEGEDWTQKTTHEEVAREDFVVSVLHGVGIAVSHRTNRQSEVVGKSGT